MKKVRLVVFILVVSFLVGAVASLAAVDLTNLTNVALNKPVVEYKHGYQSDYWNKNFITDGIKMKDDTKGSTNGWFGDGAESVDVETWIYVDLEANYTIKAIGVYPRQAAKYFPVAYDLQVSKDASNWTTVKSITGDNGSLDADRVHAITPVETRYIRVLVKERYNEYLSAATYTGHIVQISEIEAYANAGTVTEPETNAETRDSSLLFFAGLIGLLSITLLSAYRRKNLCR